jgi:hypothetical protein
MCVSFHTVRKCRPRRRRRHLRKTPPQRPRRNGIIHFCETTGGGLAARPRGYQPYDIKYVKADDMRVSFHTLRKCRPRRRRRHLREYPAAAASRKCVARIYAKLFGGMDARPFPRYSQTCFSMFATLGNVFPALLHNKLVRHQRDKLAVGRLIVLGIDIVTEQLIDVFNLAARPRDFYRVAYCALHLARRC